MDLSISRASSLRAILRIHQFSFVKKKKNIGRHFKMIASMKKDKNALSCTNVIRDESRNLTASKMEFFVGLVNG